MNILLAYATYSSGTYTASQIVAEVLAKTHTIAVKDIREVSPSELQSYDLVILASPSWWNRKSDGMPHEFLLAFMDEAEGIKLPNKLFAIFGLGDTAYPNFCGAVTHLEEFVKKIEGKLVIDSLRIDGFYFEQQQNEQYLGDWADQLSQALSSATMTR